MDGGDNDVMFVYMGGDQRVPRDVTHIRVHKSVKIITARAFRWCKRLVSIEMHDGVEIIETEAFWGCSLRGIKLAGVRVVEKNAFGGCRALVDVEFGDKLESIGSNAFFNCNSLRSIKIPKVRDIGVGAFVGCDQLTDVELSKDLETIEGYVFSDCPRIRRIAMPLKDNLLGEGVFNNCDNLSQVDLVGGIHKTISSLLLESWRNEMRNEIGRINRDLPNIYYDETFLIRRWMERVIERIEHFKSEHYVLLKEFTTLLELALWKAKLDEEFGEALSREDNTTAKKAKIDMKAARQEKRIISGANIVIKNVLPFLKLE